MQWSWKLARIANIDVYVHNTFFLLVAWSAYQSWKAFGTLAAVVDGMAYIVALFTCVVMHEFGHALMARRFNIVTRNITLLPIGGVASMESIPQDPLQEIKVALAGPAVNIVIAVLLGFWINLNNITVTPEDILATGGPFVYRLLAVNIFLAVFNLLPAFPMDGGRVLRAGLALRMPHHLATQKAANIGQGFAMMFGLLGLFYNPFLLLIAVFLWIGGAAENQAEQIKVSLGTATAADAMLTDFHILSPHDHLSRAIQLTLAGSQKDFPVGSTQQLTGVLTQKSMLQALQEQGENARISDLTLENIKTIALDTPIEQLLIDVQTDAGHMLAVSDGYNIVGFINLDNIVELLKIQAALHTRK